MLETENKAPLCALLNQDNKMIDLMTINKNIVLYFYPKDDTPGCTLEGKEFSQLHDDFLNFDTVIFGVSKDSTGSHQKFKEKHCFNFDLLADTDLVLTKSFDAWGEKSMFGVKYMGIQRKTFFINKEKIISKIWPKVTAKNHANEVLNFVKSFSTL